MTETNDSVVNGEFNGETAMATLRSLFNAVESNAVLEIQGHEYWPAPAVKDVLDDNRHLQYRLKQANRNVGKQGGTIHQLRADLAEVRQLNSRAERGEIRSLDRQVRSLTVLLESARDEITALNEKLSEQEQPTDLDKVYDGQLDDVAQAQAVAQSFGQGSVDGE